MKDPLAAPGLSKRARSQKALDLVHGHRGGRSLPRLSDFAQDQALQAEIAKGTVVRANCTCTSWLLARCDVGKACRACGDLMVAERRFTLVDERDGR